MARLASGGQQFQVGVESTKGTKVAATTKVSWPEVVVAESDANRVYPRQADGTLTQRTEGSFLGARGTSLNVSAHPFALEEFYAVAGAGVSAMPTPTQIGSSGTYLESYVAPQSTVPTFDTLTFERILTNGTQELVLDTGYVFLQSFTIDSTPPNGLTIQAAYGSRKADPNASKTAGQSLQSTLTRMEAARLAVYTADTYSDITGATGTYTQLTERVVSARHTYNTGLQKNWTQDGRDDLDFSFAFPAAGQRGHTTELRVLHDHSTSEFLYATGITESETNTPKWFQLLWTGPEAAGGESYLFSAIFRGLVETPILGATDQNGMESAAMSLVSIADPDETVFAVYSVQTARSALPS